MFKRKTKGSKMNETLGQIPVNTKQTHHDCEMIFSYSTSGQSDFSIDSEQRYKIYTTLEEIEVLKEALEMYQAEGFKEQFLLYSNALSPKEEYPEFVASFKKVHALGKSLQSLAKDDYSLTQLQDYCLEQATTYVEDFMINKQIHSIVSL